MPIVTFWSKNEKAIGQTVSAATASTVMAMEHNYKIILISVDFSNDVLEECFGAQQANSQLIKSIVSTPSMNIDTGINGLLKMAQSNRITPEIIKDYTKIIYPNRLEVLYSSTNGATPIEQQLEYLKNIILNASRYYDYVFLDLKKGLHHRQILEILDFSDIIVLNTEQGTKTLEEFLTSEQTKKYISSNKVLWNICKYDKKSKYNIKNLTRTIWRKQIIYSIPYNTLLFEASKEGKVAELLLRYRSLKNQDENSEFLEQAKSLVDGIVMKYKELQMKIK